ncbi:universal stress protein [Tabrizicola sp.]|uniref:universal stress protein n=1 Tax=Tabrizicola sp. TaxID=2005166 RepID=UPI000BDA2599|nr:universal stress protein [Tabrizicola sp.]MBY0351232.1 universal stress protein [Tabrizicola sp.]MDK2775116.1 universal stress protein [Tabrizicola sp.]OYX22263.1 MAG: universal stress protein UspA [Rhodobacterales bacterium 32-66-9]
MTKKILCPTDGSDHAMIGVRKAAELAKLTGAHLTICAINLALGGARGPLINQWPDEEAEAILQKAAAEAKAVGAVDIDTVAAVSRSAGPAIIAYGEEIGADHIVMGTGDKRGVKRLVLGSVAAEVAGQAHCTVTVAR